MDEFQEGMVLVGASSGATATITNYRLVSDLSATLIGSFYIPDPNNPNHPKFETGTKTFTITNDEDNDVDNATTIAEETFTSSGTIETVQENIISLRNARIERRREFQERNVNRDLGTRVTSSRSTSSSRETLSVGMIPLHNLSWLKMILGYSLQSVMYSSNLKMTWIFQLSSRSEQWKMDSQLQMFFHSLRLF